MDAYTQTCMSSYILQGCKKLDCMLTGSCTRRSPENRRAPGYNLEPRESRLHALESRPAEAFLEIPTKADDLVQAVNAGKSNLHRKQSSRDILPSVSRSFTVWMKHAHMKQSTVLWLVDQFSHLIHKHINTSAHPERIILDKRLVIP